MDVRDKAHADYVKGMKYKEISDKYGISINTVKSWKQRNNWQRKTLKKGAPKCKKGAPFYNGNAIGNCGGPGGPPGNHKAVTHGLFAKYLPEETLDIVKQVEESSPLDVLWNNIMLQYAQIIHAQKVMHVLDHDDIVKEIKSSGNTSTTWEISYAWDRQAALLNSQSRAMGTLNNMIRQYDELCRNNSELATEEQKARIAKLKHDIEDSAPKKEQSAAMLQLVQSLKQEDD